MTAPAMQPSRGGFSRGVGNPGAGKHWRPFVSITCGNLAEVIAYAMGRMLAAELPVIAREDSAVSHGDYVKIDFCPQDSAPGLTWGPTQRELVAKARNVFVAAIDECMEERRRQIVQLGLDGAR